MFYFAQILRHLPQEQPGIGGVGRGGDHHGRRRAAATSLAAHADIRPVVAWQQSKVSSFYILYSIIIAITGILLGLDFEHNVFFDGCCPDVITFCYNLLPNWK